MPDVDHEAFGVRHRVLNGQRQELAHRGVLHDRVHPSGVLGAPPPQQQPVAGELQVVELDVPEPAHGASLPERPSPAGRLRLPAPPAPAGPAFAHGDLLAPPGRPQFRDQQRDAAVLATGTLC